MKPQVPLSTSLVANELLLNTWCSMFVFIPWCFSVLFVCGETGPVFFVLPSFPLLQKSKGHLIFKSTVFLLFLVIWFILFWVFSCHVFFYEGLEARQGMASRCFKSVPLWIEKKKSPCNSAFCSCWSRSEQSKRRKSSFDERGVRLVAPKSLQLLICCVFKSWNWCFSSFFAFLLQS
jgi:hypothetical protein